MALDFPNAPTIGQTFTAPDGTVWTWDGVKWVVGSSASGLIAAQQIDYDTLRLTAVGTKLKALGPLTILNSVSATTINAALDGAVNIYQGTAGDCVWNLPPVQPGMCLNIMLGNMQHNCIIVPNAADQITGPPNTGYTQSSPLTIPPCLNGNYSSITFVGAPHNWLMEAIGPPIAETMGWVSRPYLYGQFTGGGGSLASGVWQQLGMTSVVDSHGWWASNAYTPKRAGRYYVAFGAFLGDSNAPPGQAYVSVFKNNGSVNIIAGQSDARGIASMGFYQVTGAIAVNGTTDTLTAQVYVISGNPIYYGGGNPAQLTIFYLGP